MQPLTNPPKCHLLTHSAVMWSVYFNAELLGFLPGWIDLIPSEDNLVLFELLEDAQNLLRILSHFHPYN
jgi:hypothetical protein